ncbi:MAG: dephospho-CoA kinase [Actinobacteria bacterium]|nr:dephospho-CoA kinase [Actinomycetota bacterium]
MILVGLTGGIGSGKSTVSSLLADKGAVIIDGDAITRELQQPGQPLLQVIAERFGSEVLDSQGALVRQRLADIVFNDAEALKDLNKIVHPAVGKELERRLTEQRATDNVVILDIPLLAENPRKGLCGTIVVDVPEDIAVQRLVNQRGMREDDARARMANQASREKRLAIADQVIDNSGSFDELQSRVNEVWSWAQTLPHVVDDDAGGRSEV